MDPDFFISGRDSLSGDTIFRPSHQSSINKTLKNDINDCCLKMSKHSGYTIRHYFEALNPEFFRGKLAGHISEDMELHYMVNELAKLGIVHKEHFFIFGNNEIQHWDSMTVYYGFVDFESWNYAKLLLSPKHSFFEYDR